MAPRQSGREFSLSQCIILVDNYPMNRNVISMIRRILLPLDPSSFCASATRQAMQMARDHQAMVTGQVILDLPEITTVSAVGFDVRHGIYPEQLQKEKISEAQQQIDDSP